MHTNWKNQLYFGDNLDILKQLHELNPKGLIDLIYIDPPFNSNRNYNVLFESVDLKDSTAQKEAFADTWSNVSYMDTLNELSDLDISLYNFLKNLDNTNISKGAISYLTIMAIRLWYMHRLLKDTGNFFLHCDSTMSHYLKIICDLIFGEKHFKNEIFWERTFNAGSSKSRANKFPQNTDSILFYEKSDHSVFNRISRPLNEGALKRYDKQDEKGRFMWAPLKTVSQQRLEELRATNQIREDKELRYPRYKKYLNEADGAMVSNLWNDIGQIATHPDSKERLGYPTQKPEALLDRIIKASTNEGDLVADFFCGCGTAISVAQSLYRKWLGVDISHLAIKLIARRLGDSYGDNILKTFDIHGFPKDIDSAKELANNVKGGRLEFEDWIIEVLLLGITNERRNEMGYDGYRTFTINDKKYIVMMEVKSGNASPTQLNHFIKTIEDKKGAMGIFICFAEHITRNMQVIAKKEGLFVDQYGNTHGDKIQVISVEDLLDDRRPNIPQSTIETFKKAEKKTSENDTQIKMEI
jgi:adenine specific DNA methylase Mod